MHYALYKKEKHLNFDKFKVEFNASLRFFKQYNHLPFRVCHLP